MEAFSKSFNFVFMVCAVLNVGKVSGSAEIYGLMVKPIRSDQDLKLHVWWNTTLPDSTNYHVTATHIDSETCTLKDSPFQNNKLIKCAPIVASAKTTEVIIPENDDGYYKHICPIQSHCTYLIEVEPMSSSSKITNIVQVPDCVEGLCSCYYAEHLPALVNTSAVINRTTSQLIVSWALGTFDETDLPENVTLKAIHIGVRRGTNNDLGWGGLHSSMKELALPIGTGTHSFDINEFAGSKFIFVIQLKVIDTRDCEHAAVPLRVTLPDSAQRLHNTTVGSKVTCTNDTVCECNRLSNFPDFLLVARLEGSAIVVTWRPLKTVTWHQTSINDIVGLSLAIQAEETGTLLCSVIVDPTTSNTHTFFVDEFAPNHGASFLLTSAFVDANNYCERTMPTYKFQTPPSKSILLPILFALLAVSIAVAIASCIFIYYKRRTKFRWKANNWRGVYVRSSGDHHPQVAMEENRLYVDMEILNARARGDADYLEVPHSCLRIGREIGKGAFGRVFMASAVKLPGLNGPKIVAIKQLKKCSSSDEFDEFLDEITMMKKVGKHPNIVALLGCCTIKEPLTMIMEYVGCGDLLEYLRKIRAKHLAKVHQLEVSSQLENASAVQSTTPVSNIFGPMVKYLDLLHTSSSTSDASYITQTDTATRPSVTETTYTMLSGTMGDEDNSSTLGSCSLEYVLDHKELHNFAKQIAFGMEHLEELQITHRDLAARNILIDERKTLKISDFGLSRTGIYVNTRNKKVPLRWLSIEAMRDNLYSNKSDVWAFGIVLWEIGTLGGYPYPSVSNHELFAYLQEGKRLERPENCTAEVYDLMLQCWREDPNERPSFKQISKHLQPHKKIYIDFNEIEPTYVFPPTSDQLRLAIANNK
ncbi:platelet-derived growth factor receptor alpha isoform X1 [Anopheles funestus]|uniref:platelet-derived growth factor receptor alpha isoform X1 n=1 Tax=Anopheles funestus TaxID=62324 RepID=UPI0020C6A425|nr:platelet-derived growth factor receptor alpha isoform X1 [Anopheles funestus]XP_049280874.1 platelet-derived growth factor receptor alpha isoform X1 [Anopheles funestus]XP_049280875.1 platelet-derived growth factor receptor alpha isoform X1 [Anopheles funestus]XP_049280876.1 platelet-derived growth factor receptor alpha isoform X1 [Anopheles funestus]XP_049280878.1 platelet-derived growth factor receptor alpha isoform X1 [Anopheles funestus]